MPGFRPGKWAQLVRIVAASGEFEITRAAGDDLRYGEWVGFTWLSGYVNADSPSAVIDEIIHEAERNGMARLPVVQIEQRAEYLKRRHYAGRKQGSGKR